MIQIYYQNCRGLRGKIAELYKKSWSQDYDIICITETWLHKEIADGEILDIANYNIFRSDRNAEITGMGRGGGVLIAVSTNIKVIDYYVIDNNHFEAVCVNIKVHRKVFSIINVYFPPGSIVEWYSSFFEFVTRHSQIKNNEICLVGDYNLPNITGPETKLICLDIRYKELSNFINLHALKLVNQVKNSNEKTLDLVIVPEECRYSTKVTKSDNPLTTVDLHHPAISIELLPLQISGNESLPKNKTYNFKKCDFLSLTTMIRDTDWQLVLDSTDCNEATHFFYNKIYEIFDLVVPREERKSRRYPSWFTKEMINLVKAKNHLNYRKNLSEFHNNKYKEIRRRLKSLTNLAYKNFLKDTEESINHNINSFWTYINHKRSNNNKQQFIMHDGTIIDDITAAEAFGRYFKTVYSTNKANYETDITADASYNNANILHINSVSEADFNCAIKKLKPKKAAGPDMIPPYILKGCADWLRQPLLHIFNLALQTATFPNVWKDSIIIPLHKSGPKSCVNNYRPIALLSSSAKLFEQIIYSKLFNHMQPFINEAQHGFMTKRSTVTNLSVFINNINEMLEKKQQIDVVYTDFQKAFDKVDHDILLRKLAEYGLTSNMLKFFASYLRSRSFAVRFNGNTSGKFEPNSGVPQGSNLGPLLFLIFINDLPDVLTFSKSLLFADDQKMFLSVDSYHDCLKLQSDIDDLYNWSIANNLPINTQKCNILTFSRSKSPLLYGYQMGGISLGRVSTITDLGVTYDNMLNFKEHVENIVSHAYRILGFVLRQSFNFNNLNTLKKLYTSLVRPKLEYASTVWYPHLVGLNKDIEKVQNKFLRFLYFKDVGNYPDYINTRSAYLRKRYEIQSLTNRRNINLVQFGFKIWNNNINDSYLLSLLKIKVPEKVTRTQSMFYIPMVSYSFHSPLLTMLRLLNEIISTVDIDLNTLSQKSFKRTLIEYYKYD